jgi:catechol 2,3-dioxygenase-like lactoylglutathione lyase family enzyme
VLELGPPAYLYVGVDDVRAAIDFYERALGAEFLWHFRRFGTEVAAVRVSADGPQVLLAEHRPTPSCLPIWTVPDLDALVAHLAAAGFADRGVTDGTPDGPVHVLRDPDGNELGFLQQDRPHALEARYTDPENDAAVPRFSAGDAASRG